MNAFFVVFFWPPVTHTDTHRHTYTHTHTHRERERERYCVIKLWH